ncbi:hypothetical protein D3C75_1387340 [compost metagenome]
MLLQEAADDLGGLVSRPVVNQDNLEALVGLLQERMQQGRDITLQIVHRNYNT